MQLVMKQRADSSRTSRFPDGDHSNIRKPRAYKFYSDTRRTQDTNQSTNQSMLRFALPKFALHNI